MSAPSLITKTPTLIEETTPVETATATDAVPVATTDPITGTLAGRNGTNRAEMKTATLEETASNEPATTAAKPNRPGPRGSVDLDKPYRKLFVFLRQGYPKSRVPLVLDESVQSLINPDYEGLLPPTSVTTTWYGPPIQPHSVIPYDCQYLRKLTAYDEGLHNELKHTLVCTGIKGQINCGKCMLKHLAVKSATQHWWEAVKTSATSWLHSIPRYSANRGFVASPEGMTDDCHYTVTAPTTCSKFSHKFRQSDHTLIVTPKPHHPHGYEAAHRAAAHAHIYNLVALNRRTVYEVSSSRRSEGHRGFHGHFTPRDFDYPVRNDPIIETDVVVMIDVDYYVDMNKWATLGVPVLLYTMTPQTLHGGLHNTSWQFSNNLFSATVTGGATYTHRLWSYDNDMMSCSGWGGVRHHLRIDKVSLDELRSLVLITPVHTELTLSWARGIRVQTNLLKRLETKALGDYDTLITTSGRTKTFHIYSHHACSGVSLPLPIVSAMFIRFIESSNPCLTDIQTTLDKLGVTTEDRTKAYLGSGLILQYFRLNQTLRCTPSVQDYTYLLNDVSENEPVQLNYDGKSRANHDSPPSITTQAPSIPLNNTSNDAAAEILRHQDVKPQNVVLPILFAQHMAEFKAMSLDEASVGLREAIAYDPSTIWEKQNLPAQRQRNTRTVSEPLPGPHAKIRASVSAFIKAELYAEPKDPRNISSTDPTHTLNLSRYTYAVKQAILKRCSWYCPGSTLPDLARQLQAFCHLTEKLGQTVAETDYSRYDGTICKQLRKAVEIVFYRDLFASTLENDQMIKLIRAEFHASSRTGACAYDPDGSRLSGSPLTTDGNTIIGAVVDYHMLRAHFTQWTPAECYARIGLHFGDDGISINVPNATTIAASLGLKLKLEERPIGYPVGFLGRLFPNPWSSIGSLQHPERVWCKLNMRLNGKTMKDLQSRWASYARSDSMTPLLSCYTNKALQLTNGSLVTDLSTDARYAIRLTGTDWPQEDPSLIAAIESQVLNVDVSALIKGMNACTTATQLHTYMKAQLSFGKEASPLDDHINAVGREIHMAVPRDVVVGDNKSSKRQQNNARKTPPAKKCPTQTKAPATNGRTQSGSQTRQKKRTPKA